MLRICSLSLLDQTIAFHAEPPNGMFLVYCIMFSGMTILSLSRSQHRSLIAVGLLRKLITPIPRTLSVLYIQMANCFNG